MSSRGNQSIIVFGVHAVVVEPIDASDFDTLEDLRTKIKKQNLPIGAVTLAGWLKIERLMSGDGNV